MTNEIFKDYIFGGVRYKVGNLGTIIGVKGELKPRLNKDGYLVVTLGRENQRRQRSVHRLVAICHVPNDDIENKTEVNHKDLDRQNPRWDNLEWVTHRENIDYSVKKGSYKNKSGEKNPNYNNHILHEIYSNNPELAKEKLGRKGVQNGRAVALEIYDSEGNYIETFDLMIDCAIWIKNTLGLKSKENTIRQGICKSITDNKPYRGFMFKKIEKEVA